MDVRLVSDEAIEQHPVGELERLLARDDGLVWVDIPVCDEEAAQVLREVFGFHPLAVQACIERNAVPKVRAYRDHIFVILHAPELGTGGHVHYVELDQFIGPRYVVTVHGPVNPAVTPEAALRETHAVRERIQAGRLRPRSAFELSYAIVSAMAQGQEAFVETVTRQVWPLEQRVTSGHLGDPEQFLEELFGTRHALLAVSNMVALGHQTYQRSAPPTGRPGRGRPPHRVRQGALRRHGRTGKSGDSSASPARSHRVGIGSRRKQVQGLAWGEGDGFVSGSLAVRTRSQPNATVPGRVPCGHQRGGWWPQMAVGAVR